MRRQYKKIDLEAIDLPGPRQVTVSRPKSGKKKYAFFGFLLAIFVSAAVWFSGNEIVLAAMMRALGSF